MIGVLQNIGNNIASIFNAFKIFLQDIVDFAHYTSKLNSLFASQDFMLLLPAGLGSVLLVCVAVKLIKAII